MSKKKALLGSYPDLHVGPLAQPLLPRFGGGELRHLFAIQLQDARVLMPHDLQGRCIMVLVQQFPSALSVSPTPPRPPTTSTELHHKPPNQFVSDSSQVFFTFLGRLHMQSSGGGPGSKVRFPHLSEEERHHIRGLPVGGVEEVRQRHRGERGERVGAVEGEVQPLGAPPAGCNWDEHGVKNVKKSSSDTLNKGALRPLPPLPHRNQNRRLCTTIKGRSSAAGMERQLVAKRSQRCEYRGKQRTDAFG